jgi:hypothetical protein
VLSLAMALLDYTFVQMIARSDIKCHLPEDFA